LAIVKQVLAEQVCSFLANRINELGGCATHLNHTTTNVLFGERIQLEAEDGSAVDLGHVGRVTRVDEKSIIELCHRGHIPVIPSVCYDQSGQLLNVNADTAATAVARMLHAEKMVYMSDVNGVRRNRDDPSSHIHSLTASEARELISDGSIAAGMIPKVEACLETLAHGVKKVHIVDGGLRHSLLLEIYTTSGVGTEIVADREK
jgi:acetylglutamate kinase